MLTIGFHGGNIAIYIYMVKLLAGVDENDVDDEGIVMFYYNAYIEKQRMKFMHS